MYQPGCESICIEISAATLTRLLADGHVGAAELRCLDGAADIDADEIFLMLDSDGDGSITTSEFGQGMAAMSGVGEVGRQSGSGLAQPCCIG